MDSVGTICSTRVQSAVTRERRHRYRVDRRDVDREYVMLLIAPAAASPARAGLGSRPSKPSERKVKA